MLDKETISRVVNEFGMGTIEIYEHKVGPGLLINCGIQEEIAGYTYRLFQFETEKDLREFLTKYNRMLKDKDSIHIKLNDLGSLAVQDYSFVKDEKEYTYEDARDDIQEEADSIKKSKQEFSSKQKNKYLFYENKIRYLKFIESININNLKKILDDLERSVLNFEDIDIDTSILEQYRFIKSQKGIIKLDESEVTIDQTSFPGSSIPKFNIFTESELKAYDMQFKKAIFLFDPYGSAPFNRYIRNEEKYKRAQMYLEKIDYLMSLKDSSKIKRMFNKNKIASHLKEIESKYSFLSKEEIAISAENLNKLFSYFEQKQSEIRAKTNNKFEMELVYFAKLCLDTPYEEALQNLDKYYESILFQYDKMSDLSRQKQKEKTKKEEARKNKGKEVYSDLVRQFEKSNLTDEEKMALLAYNSALFLIINVITSIPNYENMSEDEIKDVLSQRFKEVLEFDNLYYQDVEDSTTYYFSGILRKGYEFAESDFGKYIRDIVFDKHYIQKILDVIKTLQNIKTNIVLPEDITVYRCICTNNPSENPVKGRFLSTSMSADSAKKYYQSQSKKPVMYKIHLKKGTPITAVFPKKVLSENKILVDDLASETPIMEIMLDMNDYEIEEDSLSCKKACHYGRADDNEVKRMQDYTVYEMTIVPRRELANEFGKKQEDQDQTR